MRETAFDNDGRWKYLADRKFYAVPPKNGKLYDLAGGKPLFNKPKPAPPGGAAAGGGGAGGGGGGAGTPAASSASAGSSASSSFSSAPPPGTGEATSSVAGGHKQANKATSSGAVQSDTSGGGGAVADRRELEDGSTVRNRLLVTDGPAGGQSEAASAEGSRPRAEAEGGGRNTASVYYDDGAKNPTSVGATSYDTGGGRIQGGGQLLSAGGAAAVKSQIDGELPADGEGKPGEEKDDDSKSKKRPTDASAKEASAERKPASSAFDLVFSGDFFKKVFKQRDDSSGDGGDRRPRVVQ